MSQPKDRLPLQEVTTLSQGSREKAAKLPNDGGESQLVDLTSEPQENGTKSASNIVQPVIPKAKSAPKPRAAPVKKTAAPKVKKTKADTEFDKLTPQEQLAFLRSRSDLLRNLEAQELGTASAAPSTAAPAAVEDKTQDADLCALRLELGSVLSREAELRARERKLRLAIKRLQRKLIMAQSPIVCRVRESAPMDKVVTTLFNATGIMVGEGSLTAHRTVGIAATERTNNRHNALWALAQQSDMFDAAVATRLLDVERDATLRAHSPLPADESEPPEDDGTCMECEAEPAGSAMHVPVDSVVDSELTSSSPAVEVEMGCECARRANPAGGADQLPLVLFGQSESMYETDIYATEEQLGELEFESCTVSQVVLPPLVPFAESGACREEDVTAHPDCASEEEIVVEPVGTEEPAEVQVAPSEVKRKALFQHFAYTAEGPSAPAAKRHKLAAAPVAAPAPMKAGPGGALPPESQPASLCVVIDLTSPQAQEPSSAPLVPAAETRSSPEPPRSGPRESVEDTDDLAGVEDSAGYTPECPAGVIHYLPSGGGDRGQSTTERSAGNAPVRDQVYSGDPAPAAVEESQMSGKSNSSKESDCSILSSPEMPDFASMPVQKLRDILLHYGLKVDTKSKMVSLLRAMWQRLHKEGATKATALSKARYVQATGGRPSITSVFAPSRSAQAAALSGATGAETQEHSRGAEAAGRRKKSEEIDAAEVVAFLTSHPAWYEQVLTFVPLDLDRLHTELHAASTAADSSVLAAHRAGSQPTGTGAPAQRGSTRRISKARLLEVLDQHAVFVSRSGKSSAAQKASQH